MFYSEIIDEENKPQSTMWYSDIYTLEQEQILLNHESSAILEYEKNKNRIFDYILLCFFLCFIFILLYKPIYTVF